MNSLKRIFILVFSIIFSIQLILFSSSFLISKKFSNQNIEISNLYKFSYSTISAAHKFLSLSFKINDGFELYQGNITNYHNPIFVSINLLTKNITIEYKGTTTTKTEGRTYHSEIDSKYLAKTEIDFSKFLYILKSKKFVEFINHLQTIDLDQKKTSVFSEDGKLLYKSSNNLYSLSLKHGYYSSIEQIKNEPPYFYSVSGIAHSESNEDIPQPSIFAPIINASFKGSFLLQSEHTEEADRTSKYKFICKNCIFSNAEINANFQADISKKSLAVNIDSLIKIEKEEDLAGALDFFDKAKIFATPLQIKSFIYQNNLQSYSIPRNAEITFKLKGSAEKLDSGPELTIEHCIIKGKDAPGILANGRAKLNEELNAELILSQAKFFTDEYSKYTLQKHQNEKYYSNRLEYLQQVFYRTAKDISEYPRSKSDDLMFSIKAIKKDNSVSIYIGKINLAELGATYYKSRLNVLLDNAKKADNPIEYIKIVEPELADIASGLVKKTKEHSKISKDLWQKLLR